MDEAERRARALALVRLIRSGTVPRREAKSKFDELMRLKATPQWSDLMFWTELSDREVVDAAFAYRPIAL
ncbi:hypothetical protein [Frankia nepalensis]|uniref:Uncharacterized protein n=1 Tax=Frankia nepalensis TaxID=1836974 RepID=A0A937R635_9ACTN|nr:hypothetical protein [Frankia nepalensis]MBL7502293.1 e9imm peptide [Frankia nepalensis]MBL7514034.1 e9imm peptide [Frankia nepalensis]MBL7626418.1 hypothetical protein [Frankia nepalensis]